MRRAPRKHTHGQEPANDHYPLLTAAPYHQRQNDDADHHQQHHQFRLRRNKRSRDEPTLVTRSNEETQLQSSFSFFDLVCSPTSGILKLTYSTLVYHARLF